MKRLTLLLAALPSTLVTASAQEPAPRTKPAVQRPLTVAEQAEIRKYFDGVLFDGQSARFEWGPKKQNIVTCGHINAKNRFAAYTGWQPFYFFFGTKHAGSIYEPERGDSKIMFNALCPEVPLP